MVCNYCFKNEELNDYIKLQGSKVTGHYECPECQSSEDDMYILSKDDLGTKLRKIILRLYEHDNDLGMMYFAEKNICENEEDPNIYAQLKGLGAVCYELFEDETKFERTVRRRLVSISRKNNQILLFNAVILAVNLALFAGLWMQLIAMNKRSNAMENAWRNTQATNMVTMDAAYLEQTKNENAKIGFKR